MVVSDRPGPHIALFKKIGYRLGLIKINIDFYFFPAFLILFYIGTDEYKVWGAEKFLLSFTGISANNFLWVGKITGGKKLYFIISTVIIAFLLYFGIIGSIRWEKRNLWREIIKQAIKIEYDTIIIPVSVGGEQVPVAYYAEKYGLKKKVLFLRKNIDAAEGVLILKEIPAGKTFAIIQNSADNPPIDKGRYLIGEDSVEIERIEECKVELGPFPFIKKLIHHPLQNISICYCKK